MAAGSIVILDPVSLPDTKRLSRTPRPKSMSGLRIAFIDNTKPNFSIFCDRVSELLLGQYGVAEVKRYRKPGRTVGVAQSIINEVKATCDFAITGLGD
jgi:hypothetical protein